ncbi:cation:proton antiporter [Streptomyces sp. NPDC054765]
MAAVLQAAAALVGVLVVARLASGTARRVRQPPVIGEIALGLVLVPVLTAVAGPRVTTALLPPDAIGYLHTVGVAGLALYLAGAGHFVRPRRSEVTPRSYAWLLTGSLAPGLVAGGLLAAWVGWRDIPAERGTAPAAALVLLLAAALAVTAVPVLVRILTDRGMLDSPEGRLSVLTAVSIDALTWLILTGALVAAAGDGGRLVQAVAVIAGGAPAVVAVRLVLRRKAVAALCARWPAVTGAALGALAVLAALATERAGLTAIYGAVLVGLAVPRDGGEGPWARPVRAVARLGRLLVPVFFVTTGLALGTKGPGGFSWATLALALLLAVVAKVAGGYAGARAARLPTGTALRIGVLMNTRGLTEIAVLQAGVSAAILTPGLFLVLALMALITTAATGPLLSLVERRYGKTATGSLPESEEVPSHDDA